MTSDRRFEQDLPEILADLYMAPMPAYREQVLLRATRTRQRPAWTFIDRWLPWVATAREGLTGPRIPWRSIGFVALLAAITLALVAVLIAGSRPRTPAPFGLARSGLVAYAVDGDIYTVNPATGVSTEAVMGPERDRDPHWSRDGTRFAFLRDSQAGVEPSRLLVGLSRLYVARSDGADPRLLTPEPLAITGLYGFSPDGRQILLTVGDADTSTIVLVNSDGSGSRVLDLGSRRVAAWDAGPSWRPPDGAEILFTDEAGLSVVNVESGTVRTILEPKAGHSRGTPSWSPDGSRIAYIGWVDWGEMTAQIHLIEADGSGHRLLPLPPGAQWQAFRSWSNDGTRVLAIRGYSGDYAASVVAILPADGSGPGVEIDYSGITRPECCPEWEWAPDDASILGSLPDAQGRRVAQVLLDPIKGTATTVPWTTTSLPTWQRLAP
jgi:dipeptidyl aminopeptidase/acylaminoacyl peptidase